MVKIDSLNRKRYRISLKPDTKYNGHVRLMKDSTCVRVVKPFRLLYYSKLLDVLITNFNRNIRS